MTLIGLLGFPMRASLLHESHSLRNRPCYCLGRCRYQVSRYSDCLYSKPASQHCLTHFIFRDTFSSRVLDCRFAWCPLLRNACVRFIFIQSPQLITASRAFLILGLSTMRPVVRPVFDAQAYWGNRVPLCLLLRCLTCVHSLVRS